MPKSTTVLSSEEPYKSRAFAVVEEEVLLSNGKKVKHSTVKHNGAVVIIPKMNDGRILVISQYRHSIGKELLELPAGTLSVGEEPKDCAMREISEETGFGARNWISLGSLFPAPGFCDEIQHGFLASDLYDHKLEGDEDEIIETIPLTMAQLHEKIKSGEFCDGKSLAFLYRAFLAGHL